MNIWEDPRVVYPRDTRKDSFLGVSSDDLYYGYDLYGMLYAVRRLEGMVKLRLEGRISSEHLAAANTFLKPD